MKRLEFAARLVLIYVAGALSAIEANGNWVAPFAVLSMFLTAELASRSMARTGGRDGVDAIVRIAGSIIVSLVLGGLALNFLSEGLTRPTWSAFWVIISLAVLWWRRKESTSFNWLKIPVRPASAQTAWFALAGAIVIVASVIAVQGANNDLQSPLQMWVQGKSPGSITVAVSSGIAGGPYRLVTDPEVTKTSAFDAFTLTSSQAVERSLPAGASTRYNIHLVDANTGAILRTVIVDSPPFSK